MRKIAEVDKEAKAASLCQLLVHEGILASYDKESDHFSLWVEDEDKVERALKLIEQAESGHVTLPKNPAYAQVRRKKIEIKLIQRHFIHAPLSKLIIALCVIFFLVDAFQEVSMLRTLGPVAQEAGFTPLEEKLLFDFPEPYEKLEELLSRYPNTPTLKDPTKLPVKERSEYEAIEQLPTWKGFYGILLSWRKGEKGSLEGSLFGKIRQGEVWRLITPVFLHRGLLHILFNMAWLWILGRQIEERIGKIRLLLLSLIIGVVANVAQYLMSGPFFLGYSGIVVGMAGFIWMRQKLAPWEGYPLQQATALFILIFVIAMSFLEITSFSLQLFTKWAIEPAIANTAHLVGGLTGISLARLSLFKRPE